MDDEKERRFVSALVVLHALLSNGGHNATNYQTELAVDIADTLLRKLNEEDR